MRLASGPAMLALIMIAPAAAQQAAQPQPEMITTALTPEIAVLSYGNQGNVGVSHGVDGTVLIDAMYANASAKIKSSVQALGAKPIRMVINTHWHHDHSEGNENFAGNGAIVIAHENVRKRLSTLQFMSGLNRTVLPSAKGGLPLVTFTGELSFHLNGDVMHVVHVPNAHTDGDVLVYWEKANVLQMGDLFNRVTLPLIGINEGGSIDGMIRASVKGLQLSNDTTRIIPGHGAVGTKADLQAYHDMLVDIRGKVAAGISGGRSVEEIVRDKPAARYGMLDAFVKPDLFVELVYYSLRKLPMPVRGPKRSTY